MTLVISALTAVVMAPAAHASSGTVMGTVTDSDGQPLEDALVEAWAYDNRFEHWYWAGDTYTGPDGAYELSGIRVPAQVTVAAYVWDDRHVETYLGGATSLDDADTFQLSPGAAASGKDVQLVLGGTVKGKITDSDGQPVEDAEVVAWVYDDRWGEWGWETVAYSYPDGTYELTGIGVPSQVTVSADPYETRHVRTYIGGATSVDGAETFSLAQGDTASGKDVQLLRSGTVTGKVTDSDGEPVEDVEVRAVTFDGSGGGSWEPGVLDYTDADGVYRLSGVVPGQTTISADARDDEHVPTHLGGHAFAHDADHFTLAPGATESGKDINLLTGGTVTGTITDSDGEPVAGADVRVGTFDTHHQYWVWSWTTSAVTENDGSYQVTGVLPGEQVTVSADAYDGVHLETFLDDRTWREQDDWGRFALVAGEAVAGKDVRLRRGVRVSGTITDSTGSPLQHAGVWVDYLDPDTAVWEEADYTSTGHDGSYALGPLDIEHAVTATVGAWNWDHAATYYGTRPTAQEATALGFGSDMNVTGADVQLVRGGTVDGAALIDDQPLQNSSIDLYRVVGEGRSPWAYDDTGPDGAFSFTKVFPGEYTLGGYVFADVRYLGDVKDVADADTFEVVDGETTTVDLLLAAEDESPDVTPTPTTSATPSPSPSDTSPAPGPSSPAAAAETTTRLSLSKAKRQYGRAAAARIEVAGGATPVSGAVQLRLGDQVLGTADLSGGAVKIAVPRKLAVGRHTLSAHYLGSSSHRASSSAGAVLKVRKAKSTVRASFVKKKVKAGKRAKVKVVLRAKGFVPRGTVTVQRGKKKLVAKPLNRKGRATLRLPKLRPGKHKLRVAYTGSAVSKKKKSAKLVLRVRR